MMVPRTPSSGFQMIRNIDIRGFRCFQRLEIKKCRRINVIVGDNGTGKTALVEAIFLALGGSPEIAVRFRQLRGLDIAFSGPTRSIEEALWKDLFFKHDWNRPISVELQGDGVESRKVTVSRGGTQLTIPLRVVGEEEEKRTSPITFLWRDSEGKEHVRVPRVGAGGLKIEGEDEDLPDFFLFSANQTISSLENAARFSDLSRAGRLPTFIKIFTAEYPWVKNLNIEVVAGSPVIFATMADSGDLVPLPMVSGGINRIMSIMLALASRDRSVVLVDEIEDGIYHKHQRSLWRGVVTLAREYNGQVIATTHSEEWLEAIFAATGDQSDVALWRIERGKQGPVIRQFPGAQSAAAIKAGEVR